MIKVNKQWSTWVAWVAGAMGAGMAFIPGLNLPEPWPAVLMLFCSVWIYAFKNIKQKPKG